MFAGFGRRAAREAPRQPQAEQSDVLGPIPGPKGAG